MSILEAGRNITRQILGSSGVSTPRNLESLFESDNESGYDADGAHSSGTSRMSKRQVSGTKKKPVSRRSKKDSGTETEDSDQLMTAVSDDSIVSDHTVMGTTKQSIGTKKTTIISVRSKKSSVKDSVMADSNQEVASSSKQPVGGKRNSLTFLRSRGGSDIELEQDSSAMQLTGTTKRKGMPSKVIDSDPEIWKIVADLSMSDNEMTLTHSDKQEIQSGKPSRRVPVHVKRKNAKAQKTVLNSKKKEMTSTHSNKQMIQSRKPSKRVPVKTKNAKAQRTVTNSEKQGTDHEESDSVFTNGNEVRRSCRHRIKPLAFWKLENPMYIMTDNGLQLGGVSKPINPTPKQAKRRPVKRKIPTERRYASKAARRDEIEKEEEEEPELEKYGIKDINQTMASVLGADGKEIEMELIQHSDDLDMRSVSGKIPTSKDTVIFAKPFNHSSFSAGVVVIQPGGEKSSSVVQKSTLVFVVESGYLVVQIHHASFYAKEGTLFLVPVGNAYSIKNIGHKEALLHFVHVKKV